MWTQMSRHKNTQVDYVHIEVAKERRATMEEGRIDLRGGEARSIGEVARDREA